MELGNRHLGYREASTPNIHSSDSGLVFTPAVAAEIFPLGTTGMVGMQDIGLFGDFKYGIVPKKTIADGSRVSATWTRYDLGLKYRFAIRRLAKPPVFGFSLSYGQDAYVFHPSTPPAEPLDTPSAAYTILRPRLDARVPAGPVAVLLGVGYLAVLNTVDFAQKFKDPSIYAWEADLGLVVPIGSILEVRGGVAYRRFVHIFGQAAGLPYNASVADDQMLRVDLGASAHF
jgi:hypothetical protein